MQKNHEISPIMSPHVISDDGPGEYDISGGNVIDPDHSLPEGTDHQKPMLNL
jgi:hypothetical protein